MKIGEAKVQNQKNVLFSTEFALSGRSFMMLTARRALPYAGLYKAFSLFQ
jgi:hypothetical protein